MSDEINDRILPGIGVAITLMMIAAPCRDLKGKIDEGHLGSLNPSPWPLMLGMSYGWLQYCLYDTTQEWYLYVAYAPGLLLSVWLNMGAVKLQYQMARARVIQTSLLQFMESHNNRPDEENVVHQSTPSKRQVALALTTIRAPSSALHEYTILMILTFWLILSLVLELGDLSSQEREKVLRFAANGNLMLFYGAPLSTILTVMEDGSSATIHFWTMITNTLNAIFWTAYGIAVSDLVIAIPHAAGVLCGISQGLLCVMFPRLPTVNDMDEDRELKESAQNTASSADDESEKEATLVPCEESGGNSQSSSYKESMVTYTTLLHPSQNDDRAGKMDAQQEHLAARTLSNPLGDDSMKANREGYLTLLDPTSENVSTGVANCQPTEPRDQIMSTPSYVSLFGAPETAGEGNSTTPSQCTVASSADRRSASPSLSCNDTDHPQTLYQGHLQTKRSKSSVADDADCVMTEWTDEYHDELFSNAS